MTTIRLTFPAGRYHATPWGRHVNEGVAEWPPSPYRFLRALYDVWQRKCSDLPEAEVREVLADLAGSLPRFRLPRAAATHTRAYLSSNNEDPTAKNLVFDSFLVFDRSGECFVCWSDLELTAGARATLARLLSHLNYLGRSESWVQAELWEGNVDGGFNCEAKAAAEGDEEFTTVACAAPASGYEGEEWMRALTFSTANLLKERASAPPLLRKVQYARGGTAIETDPPRHSGPRHEQDVQAVMFGLDATVLPLVTTTLEVAEQIRVRLMGAHKGVTGDESLVSAVFSGKGPDGGKRLDHGHVYVLPLGNDLGRIDRVLMVNPLRGFSESELEAVRRVRALWQRDGRPEVRCVVTWQGRREEATEERGLVWESATPFVPPRHRRKGRDFGAFLEEEVRRECRNHGVEEPAAVEPLKEMPGIFHEVEYRRNRKQDPVRPGYALRVRFGAERGGIFAIGYGAHFGLGQFRAVRGGGE